LDKADVAELLRKKKEMYEMMLSYFRQQAALSFMENPSEYQSFMERKSECINEIAKNEIILQSILHEDQDGRWRAMVDSCNKELRQTMSEIQKLNDECQNRLKREKAAVQKRLTAIRLGKKGMTGYNSTQNMNPAGMFTDKRR
jgi:hypothetical protein